jgi:hypothetical protein
METKEMQGKEVTEFQRLINVVEKEKRYWTLTGNTVLWFPVGVPQGISILGVLNDVFTKYKRLIRHLDGYSFHFDDNDIKFVDSVCDSIINILQQYLTGNVIKAHEMFIEMMDSMIEDFPYKEVENDLKFYRMRKELDIVDEKGFHHLPTDKRYKCRSERFSIAGYPCFYLGYSKKDCFVEINKTGSMIALSLNDKGALKVFDLTFSEAQENGKELKKYLKVFPLIASCYVVTLNSVDKDEAYFREEYVIPQMLTSYLKYKGKFDGICYYSVRNDFMDCLGRGENDYRNLVLFPHLSTSDEYDQELMNLFHWYKPFNVK